MLFNPRRHTKDQIETIEKKALSLLEQGVTVMSWASEGSSGNLEFTMPVEKVLLECDAYFETLAGTRVKSASTRFSC